MTSWSLFLGTVPNRDVFQVNPKRWSLFSQFSPYSVHLVPIFQVCPEKKIECYIKCSFKGIFRILGFPSLEW